MSKEKIIIFGGSGFIGSEAGKFAVSQGLDVVSVAQIERPPGSEAWMEKVRWVAADVFDVASWKDYLQGAKAVIHAIGIIKEYPDKGVTFERINGDTAIIIAKEAAKAKVEKIVFMSAAIKPPGVSEHYLAAKRRAEKEIAALELDSAFFRPGPIYGPRQPMPYLQRVTINFLSNLPIDYLKKARPVKVEIVGPALIKAALDLNIKGVLDSEAIKSVALN